MVELDVETEESLGRIPVTRRGSWLILHPAQETGVGWLQTTFFEPVVLAWMDGACIRPVELTPRPRGTLRVEVDGDPEGIEVFIPCFDAVSYSSAPGEDPSVRESVVLVDRGASARCLASLTRKLEMGVIRGSPREVVVRQGQVTEIALEAPVLPAAGWRLSEAGDGTFEIDALGRDSPAHLAGLWSTDRIVAVAGTPADAIDLDDVENVTLPSTITVVRGGEEREIVLE